MIGTDRALPVRMMDISRALHLNFCSNLCYNQVFTGNRNPLKKIKHLLDQRVKARYIRIFPTAFSNENFACLRVALLGCDKCKYRRLILLYFNIYKSIFSISNKLVVITIQSNSRIFQVYFSMLLLFSFSFFPKNVTCV